MALNDPGDAVFIVWGGYCRRAEVLGKRFHCPVLFIDHIISNRGDSWKYLFWIDYLYKGIHTLSYLIRRRPTYVFAQSPPSFCPVFCWIYCKLFHGTLIVDGHNNAFDKPWTSVPFYLRILSSSNTVMVHNDELERHLKTLYRNIPFYVLPDKFPRFPPRNEHPPSSEKPYFLVPLSFAPDEPFEEMFDAIASFLSTGNDPIEFVVTGNYRRKRDIHEKYHAVRGIRFVGYVENSGYDILVSNAHGVIALTKQQKTQQCAAVEAMGAAVPLIVSDTDTNRRLFPKGAILTSINVTGIRNSLERFLRERDALSDGIVEMRTHWDQEWEKAFLGLKERVPM